MTEQLSSHTHTHTHAHTYKRRTNTEYRKEQFGGWILVPVLPLIGWRSQASYFCGLGKRWHGTRFGVFRPSGHSTLLQKQMGAGGEVERASAFLYFTG